MPKLITSFCTDDFFLTSWLPNMNTNRVTQEAGGDVTQNLYGKNYE